MDLGNIFTSKFKLFWQAVISSRLIATIEKIRLITNIKDKIFCTNLASISYILKGKKDIWSNARWVFEMPQNSGLF